MAGGFLQGDEPTADIDAWLREHLGRRLTVAFVAADGDAVHDERAGALTRALADYAEIRVALPFPDGAPLAQQLNALRALDPEVVLVVDAAPQEAATAGQGERERRLRALLDGLERGGIFDRSFVALLGPGVNRARARRLGFEDGFAAELPEAELARILAREGVAVDQRRRRGSSPPCYL